jgi:type I restriction enzyme M protein
MLYHLSPTGSMALLLANGSMSSNTNGEGDIRKALVEADLVECIVALPGQLFTNTQIPACIWFLTKSKKARQVSEAFYRDRRGETLFIDARKLGYMKDRVLRDFTEEDSEAIIRAFHKWRWDESAFRENGTRKGHTLPSIEPGDLYADQPGFCFSAKLADMEKADFVLTPGRYVGAADVEDDGEPFADKMARLREQLDAQFIESSELEMKIKANLEGLGL